MYSMFHAGWYDKFQHIWGPSKAEGVFAERMRVLSDKKTNILDLGCGTGANMERIIKYKVPYKEYTGMDMTPAMLARAKEKFPHSHFVEGDAGSVKGAYGLIISTWLFEHLTNEERKKILAMPGKHLHMYLGGRERYGLWLRAIAKLFQFTLVDDAHLNGKKRHYGIATTLLEVS